MSYVNCIRTRLLSRLKTWLRTMTNDLTTVPHINPGFYAPFQVLMHSMRGEASNMNS